MLGQSFFAATLTIGASFAAGGVANADNVQNEARTRATL